MEANKRNQQLKWAVNEVANGDAVNKLALTLEDEQRAREREAQKQQNVTQKSENESTRDPFDSYDN
jgi:hypothetical protein